MTETATVSMPIDPKMLIFIAIDGIETSCRAYWAEIDRFPSAALFDGYEERLKDNTLPDNETLFCLRDDEDGMADAEERPWVPITMMSLRAATQWALANYNHLFSFHVNSKGVIDDIDYDGWGADAILQKATLDEVVYG